MNIGRESQPDRHIREIWFDEQHQLDDAVIACERGGVNRAFYVESSAVETEDGFAIHVWIDPIERTAGGETEIAPKIDFAKYRQNRWRKEI